MCIRDRVIDESLAELIDKQRKEDNKLEINLLQQVHLVVVEKVYN